MKSVENSSSQCMTFLPLSISNLKRHYWNCVQLWKKCRLPWLGLILFPFYFSATSKDLLICTANILLTDGVSFWQKHTGCRFQQTATEQSDNSDELAENVAQEEKKKLTLLPGSGFKAGVQNFVCRKLGKPNHSRLIPTMYKKTTNLNPSNSCYLLCAACVYI